jgi:oligoribonuclease NrnB/cAMP/cGMP phosphodiesterase (DHH superfamily)|tara:strand:+ start:987 stop:1367 length:381 start_codon:yes stop_codon:yes gene_type:complete
MPRKTTRKTTKATTRKKKLDNITQTDAMADKFEPTTLNQIFGDDGGWKYKTLDTDEYKNYLNGLNKSDLQSHAVEIGIIPIDNKDQLMKRLVREFNRHAAAYKKPAKKSVNLEVSQDILDILAEGR